MQPTPLATPEGIPLKANVFRDDRGFFFGGFKLSRLENAIANHNGKLFAEAEQFA